MSENDAAAHGEIQRLIVDYCLSADSGDAERIAQLFTADARLSFSHSPAGLATALEGVEAIVAALTGYFAVAEQRAAAGITVRHVPGAPSIVLDGDEARATTPTFAIRTRPQGDSAAVADIGAIGRYIDRFVRADGEWRIAERRLEYDPPGPFGD